MNFDYTFNVVLYNPQIPPNTGNIIRLCKNTGCRLYLIKPLGFSMSDKSLKRARLDYCEYKNIFIYETFDSFLRNTGFSRFFLVTKFGNISYENRNINSVTVLYSVQKLMVYPMKFLNL